MSVVSNQSGVVEQLFRLSVEQYEGMIDAGVLTSGDAVELLDGVLVRKMPKNPPHTTAVLLAVEALRNVIPSGFCVRLEAAIRLETSQPELDVTVVRGTLREYASRHPLASDVSLVVEVADSTLKQDRTSKYAIYASAGISQYWILNLLSREVEVYLQPDVTACSYQQVKTYSAQQLVPLVIDGKWYEVSVDSILP
jgi:Uma2 family endonuclease